MHDPEPDLVPLVKPLTQREQEVLTLIGDGLTNRQIGKQLVVARSTVKWYVRQIYNKLDVLDREGAIAQARELGLLEPADRRRLNLPPQPTLFVGRKTELAQLVKIVADPDKRLVTILGPGGIGKTRLAIEVARKSADSFVDGVFFVSLASLKDPLSILPQIASALSFTFHVRDQSEQWEYDPEKEQLLSYLQEKQLLLVLDNAEHLLTTSVPSLADWKQGVEQVSAEILQRAPRITILTTSRQRLNMQGETQFTVGGLTVPRQKELQTSSELSLEEITGSDALQLFVQSAGRAQVGFRLTRANKEDVVDICRLVEGMPLGIELAAAWVALLTPAEIADEIKRSLDFLETTLSDVPDRHRSIRSIFESTWHSLTENEQSVFQQLSVFQDGFTWEAAKVVTGVTLAELRGLVNKSLLRPNFKGRYQIHDLLRQFGAERLAFQPSLETQARDRHCSYYATFLSQKEVHLSGPNHRQVLAEIGAELDNVRAAWSWAVRHNKLAELELAVESLCEFYRFRGLLDEASEAFYPAVWALGWEGLRSLEALPESHEMFQETLHLLAPNTDSKKVENRQQRVLGKVLARYGRFY